MKILRNILAVISGIIIGSVINMGIIELGPLIIPNPEDFDNSTMETLASTIHLLGPINYITVFLAHGLGTLAGAFVVAKIATTKKKIFALSLSGWFLLGGIAAVFMFPAPTWYNIIDLVFAYLPMAWLGWKLAGGKK
ncbi:MAG: hypothetical protein HRT73_14470 [Flavobacteriales bacterium]|nr:hypothetical protein [Flavobacteriales bacterium]NQX99061.1 hypothetical protein [Flavobacteriales bacterium]